MAGQKAGRKCIKLLSISKRQCRIKKARRKVSKESQGDELDIHAVYAGNLDRAWRRTRKVASPLGNSKSKRVRIVLDILRELW